MRAGVRLRLRERPPGERERPRRWPSTCRDMDEDCYCGDDVGGAKEAKLWAVAPRSGPRVLDVKATNKNTESFFFKEGAGCYLLVV